MARLRSQAGPVLSNPPIAEARQLAGLDPKRIFAAVAEFYGVDGASLSRRHDPHLAARSRPGSAAATPRRRCGNWPNGWAFREPIACPT